MNPLAMQDLGRAFGTMRAILREIEPDEDRRIAIDAMRDALDRDAASLNSDLSRPSILAGTWTVEGVLHQGQPFVVLEVRHRDLTTRHAVKTLDPSAGTNPLFRRILLREGSHQMRLRHPALLPAQAVLRLGDGRPAILMDLCKAPTLGASLGERLSPEETLALALRLAEGLNAIHQAGLVHLDLTPANILMPDGDPAKAVICDFGLSLPTGSTRLSDEIAVAQTAGFAAPEQDDRARSLDERTDLFALGAVLRQALADKAEGRLAAALRSLCADLTVPDPDARPLDMAQVRHRLIGMTSEFHTSSTTVLDAV